MSERITALDKLKKIGKAIVNSAARSKGEAEESIDNQTAREIDLKFGHLSELPKPMASTSQPHSH